MRLSVDDANKVFCIFLSSADQRRTGIQAELMPLYREYKQKKYSVAVFHSGQEDLEGLTRDLLLYNRRAAEEKRMGMEKNGKSREGLRM